MSKYMKYMYTYGLKKVYVICKCLRMNTGLWCPNVVLFNKKAIFESLSLISVLPKIR